MPQGWFRIIFWQRGAVPDASLLKTAYNRFDDAKDLAEKMMSTDHGKLDYPYGYTIVVEMIDNPLPSTAYES